MIKFRFNYLISVILLLVSSCSSTSNIVVSNDADLNKYKYVIFKGEYTGDNELADVMMLIQNEISNTRLKPISISNIPNDYLGHTLSPDINIKSEKWDGGRTYITVVFHDFSTDESVVVIKSSGIGMSIPQDQKLAFKEMRKKLQSVFRKQKNNY